MKITITGRNYKVSEHLEQITEQKLAKLDKYFDGKEADIKVAFKKQANTLTTEVMLDYCGKFVRATFSSENPYDNLDMVLPKLEGQIRKYRTRFDKNHKNVAFNGVAEFDGDAKWEKKQNLNLVKEKKFKLTPMTVNEAIEEMELLGHTFYVFLEAKSNTVQVLYLRNDGDLGLIDPEI
jgi:putative sigma-54 modulation protein